MVGGGNMGRFKDAIEMLKYDESLKKFNTFTNDITQFLTHVILFFIGVSVAEQTFFKVMLDIYILFVIMSMITPEDKQ